jgi:hypothetical protein
MSPKYDILQENEQDPQKASQELAGMLEIFLSPLLIVLDRCLDKRKVTNICAVLLVI